MSIPYWTPGGTIDLMHLRDADLTAELIADGLAKINRFNGRTPEPWSVAAHSVLVADLVPVELKAWALLHDAHEYILGDWAPPAVTLIAELSGFASLPDVLGAAKGSLDRLIGAVWQVAVRSMSERLRRADMIAMQAEAFVLMGMPLADLMISSGDSNDFDRAVSMVREMSIAHRWPAARDLWLDRVREYMHLGLFVPPRGA